MDPQVRPLIFTVRHWAKVNFLSHKNPGPWLSNFMYSFLVICFLQLRSQPILPPLKNLLLTGKLCFTLSQQADILICIAIVEYDKINCLFKQKCYKKRLTPSYKIKGKCEHN